MGDVFSSRKIISGLVLLSVGVLITLVKNDIPTNLLSLMQSLYMCFVAGNSVQYIHGIVTNKTTVSQDTSKKAE